MSTVERNRPFDKGETAETMVRELMPAIEGKTGGEYSFHLNNGDRSVGARISGEIAKRHGNQGMADAPITLRMTGVAGQCYGVWKACRLTMYIGGDGNDCE